VNPEPDECDLSARAAPSLCAPFGNACRWTTVDAETPAAEGSPAVEISAISLLLVCGLLLSELWLATRFGFSRGGDA
jgi:hypothetical protein